MTTRGFTLIEMMIAVSILGIGAVSAGELASSLHAEATEAVLWERAEQVLENEAAAYVQNRPVDPKQRQALIAALPEAQLSRRKSLDADVISVSWRSPRRGWHTRSLLLVGRAR